jgi:hypothetical protein
LAPKADITASNKCGALNNYPLTCDAGQLVANQGLAMKLLQIVPRDGRRLYGAMIKKQAKLRSSGRGTFLRAKARKRNAAKWTHVRYKGSIGLEPFPSQAVQAIIKSPERGDEARLLSSFLGWLDRHFGEDLSSVNIEYRKSDGSRQKRGLPRRALSR